MLYAGLDLSRQRLDVHLLDEDGRTVEVTAVRPEAGALRALAAHVLRQGQEVTAAIESMTGARFVHDTLERYGWDVEIADAAKVKGIAPLAAKTDKIDARVLAELARLDLVPAIWLPDPRVRAERERARFRLHLCRHRTALKNRIHATLMTFGQPVPMADLFGTRGRELLAGLALPEPWTTTLATSLAMVDELDTRIDACEADLRRLGFDHPAIPLLLTVPGVGPILAYSIASEIGDIGRGPAATLSYPPPRDSWTSQSPEGGVMEGAVSPRSEANAKMSPAWADDISVRSARKGASRDGLLLDVERQRRDDTVALHGVLEVLWRRGERRLEGGEVVDVSCHRDGLAAVHRHVIRHVRAELRDLGGPFGLALQPALNIFDAVVDDNVRHTHSLLGAFGRPHPEAPIRRQANEYTPASRKLGPRDGREDATR
jgi:transposase